MNVFIGDWLEECFFFLICIPIARPFSNIGFGLRFTMTMTTKMRDMSWYDVFLHFAFGTPGGNFWSVTVGWILFLFLGFGRKWIFDTEDDDYKTEGILSVGFLGITINER